MMEDFKNIRKIKELNSKLDIIVDLEKKGNYKGAFEALVLLVQILNVYIIREILKLRENVDNNFYEFLSIYKQNSQIELYNCMNEILAIYEEYPSKFVDLDYEKLKKCAEILCAEAFK